MRCEEGEALDLIQDEQIELDGELPLNTFSASAPVMTCTTLIFVGNRY